MTDVTRPMGGEPPEQGREDLIGREAVPGATGEAGVGGAEGASEAQETPGAPTATRAPADPSAPTSRMAPLLPREETDKFELRMQQAVSSFVDGPRAAIEEADHVMEEIANRFTDAVTQRRRTLRRSWEATDEATPATSDTEQLRLALRDYRELADRLLRH
ncbi:hypothetical protein SSP24_66290 [Streptomyces spinoverrucosus]|uniref:Uncharacterized protein n=1 Tax=Streptomyces spinoverrucosus TaxID=284043 RepID=A0A4Y3VPW9_9ACTN|nr:hypothetical protein [Streptomyces spinoverrucosus]GEC08974.1 hypothetical protein SSP24_66290 [Streptomyces spinoverrucosus]GHB66012.1 hypothetical protein GCM10010397_40060 [Streptomyces spinoverrucosus]